MDSFCAEKQDTSQSVVRIITATLLYFHERERSFKVDYLSDEFDYLDPPDATVSPSSDDLSNLNRSMPLLRRTGSPA
jgi:hypothetical protein